MKIFEKTKDGGPESPVDAYFLCEIKSLFSIAVLKFNKGRREEYHSHAFNALTWYIKGDLIEEHFTKPHMYTRYTRSLLPKLTRRTDIHRVKAEKDSWCFTIRGPWVNYWAEYSADRLTETILSHGRRVVAKIKRE